MSFFSEFIFKKKYAKYNPVKSWHDLDKHIDFIKNFTNIIPKNMMEIGANFAQDADYFGLAFNINPKDIYVFEANPELYDAIKKIHPGFQSFNYAVYNQENDMIFNCVPITEKNTGVSSLLKIKKQVLEISPEWKQSKSHKIKSIRMDNFMDLHNIKEIDFVKIDVEGVNYEALSSFGNRIKDIKSIHCEAEMYDDKAFEGQKESFSLIKDYLEANNFELVYFNKGFAQSDSLWIRKDQIRILY